MKIKHSWDEVTIADFHRINSIASHYNDKINLAGDDIDFMLAIISVLAGEDIQDMPTDEFNELEKKASFINTPPVVNQPKKQYRIGEHTFLFNGLGKFKRDATVREMKAIQYIDALHLAGDQTGLLDNIHMLMAVILQRKGGKEYNEKGFSVSENAEIIRSGMSITDAISIHNFFFQLSDILTSITKHYSESRKPKKIRMKTVFRSLISLLKRGVGLKTSAE